MIRLANIERTSEAAIGWITIAGYIGLCLVLYVVM